MLDLLRTATFRSEAEVRAEERRLEWGRIYTALTRGDHKAAACYLEDVADPEME